MNDGSSLEVELQRRANAREEDAADLWGRYKSMKGYLTREYYPWIQANSPFLTDHGEQHIRSVIQAAGSLLNKHLSPEIETQKRSLSSLDIFLVLSGILWHDVGNVYGRSGHAERAVEMTNEIKKLGFPDPAIHRLVTEISSAHSGKNGLVKASPEEDCSTLHSTHTVYPRALAAVVRFADEVSENRFRISTELLPKVPDANRIFWEYANSITASRLEPERKRVVITIALQQDAAVKRFPCPEFAHRVDGEGQIHLMDYILCRLEKMNNERAYCSPAFLRYAVIEEIEARFTLLEDTKRVNEATVFFRDAGVRKNDDSSYPNIQIFDDFYNEHPDWRPERLKEALTQ